MKEWICFGFLICVEGVTLAQGVDYQEGTIDLTQNIDLKMVFDGGLRPTQTPGLETMGCQVENAKVKIIFPENRLITVLVERGIFDLDADQNLVSMDFYGPFQPINDAINQAEQYCQVLSLSPGNLEALRTSSGSYDHPSRVGWGSAIDTLQFSTQLILRPRYHFKENGADILFVYRAKYGSKPCKFSSTPIEPPVGYEKYSMTPPKWHPSGPAYPPLSFDQAKAIGEKALKDLQAKQAKGEEVEPSAPPVQSSPALSTPESPKARQTEGGTIWIMIGVLIVVIGSAIILFLWSKK